ncbi:MAG: hypothetical protein H0T84_04620 [Tatlockia sp.]|nr:hypothetical protein [Tatlockia sp.]
MTSSEDILEDCLNKIHPPLLTLTLVQRKTIWFSIVLAHPELKISTFKLISKQICLNDHELLGFLSELGNIRYLQAFLDDFENSQRIELIKKDCFKVCQRAGYHGQLEVFKFFEIIIPDLVREIIVTERNNNILNSTYMYAAFYGHLEILKHLELNAPDFVQDMISCAYDQFDPFKGAARQGQTETCYHILAQSIGCFAYAEMHEREYNHIITPFVNTTLVSLHEESEAFGLQNPNGVFDLLDRDRARFCFYLIRNLIRRNDRAFDDELRFLLNIPSVKTLAHQEITQGKPNELLRLAMATGNQEAATLLLNIEAVRRLAEENDFYREERSNGVDLRQLAQDRESSMIALTEGEAKRLEKAIAHYQPIIQTAGIEVIMQGLRNDLIERYLNEPAIININEESIKLPLDYEEFKSLKLTTSQTNEALMAYHRHPAHTTWRYLSKPNPWMHKHASYVYINEDRTERWSTFEEYQPLIALMYLATIDKEIKPTGGHTLESRFSHFINEFALIGRAHNWDKTRIRDGKREEFDNVEEGDRPSCYSGVKRRGFQSVIGHPFFDVLTLETIDAEIHQFAFAHFKTILSEKNKHELKAILDEVLGIDDLPNDQNVARLECFNISVEKQNSFIVYLKEKYGAQFIENKEFMDHVLDSLLIDSKINESRFRYHVLKLYDLSGFYPYLETLCLKTKDEFYQSQVILEQKVEVNVESNHQKANQEQERIQSIKIHINQAILGKTIIRNPGTDLPLDTETSY